MSCDWDVWCDDCKESHGFNDANHEEQFMLELVRQADALADFSKIYLNIKKTNDSFCLTTYRGNVDPEWFARHKGHTLLVKNEYGQFFNECNERINCKSCTSSVYCRLPKRHSSEHSAIQKK